MHYLESSAFMAANDIYAKMEQMALDPEEAIRQWNASQEQP
jgi:hypothetical protein